MMQYEPLRYYVPPCYESFLKSVKSSSSNSHCNMFNMYTDLKSEKDCYVVNRQVIRIKSKSSAVVKYQRMFVVLKTTSNVKQH